ncbi:hypothetical protein FSZ31_04950 [Sphingorhabdus soli]|uniref:Uncharacterized protein n=1 Tax=Flavisphingopyxis soli TaxID=2601267 RepID=A0A5C6UNB6_9SPHN|nr:hypothetical protein [Sphingorhabdus soli]TXC74070.1 hypothetical protein FSZ31_04950 [Sphingorhabdus soli]
MEWTKEKIEALPAKGRDALFKNARALNTAEAKRIVDLMIENDFLVSEGGGLPRDHPTIQTIEEIIRSDEGRAGGITATSDGLPAMAGVDKLLSDALGFDYGSYDTTSWAGTLMVEVMEEAGYVKVTSKKMPPESVMKTAAFFKKR